MATTTDKQNVVNAAHDVVYTDTKRLVEDFAKRFALENFGQYLVDHLPSLKTPPEQVYASCWNDLYQNSESDEMAEALESERKAWLKEAKKTLDVMQKEGLALTMRNAKLVWRKLL